MARDGHPGNAGAPAATVASMDAHRDIVLAVANPLQPPSTHAGSSLLGYAPPAHYGAGQRALSVMDALKRRYGLREIAGWPIKPLGLYCAVLEPPPGTTRDELLKALAADARVQLAQPLQDFSVYAQQAAPTRRYNDPYVDLQRGFVLTDAASAHALSQGQGVDVAIVDTGVDVRHPELQGRIRDVHNLVDDDEHAFDADPHGTEVAGIVAADGNNRLGIVGIAPKATLSIYKACWYPPVADAAARCNSLTLAKALAAIADTRVRVVNLSLGGPIDPLLHMLLTRLLDQGRIVVAAMPPDGKPGGFPNDVPGVIVVRVAGAGTAPPGVLSAPGTDILTTQPDSRYDFTTGSSMAAAHVSGIIALLLALAPELDARGVHALLRDSSRVSGGVLQVNAAAAVEQLRGARRSAP
ncbi:S8 family serine peptidase [Rhodanobacter sp. S2-g]|uniref:S8 family serine peptidase n=1 Tax=Rhodanobacter geophilus TaxID=3162488 RepID=A0ABV3QLJ7_9GAMM